MPPQDHHQDAGNEPEPPQGVAFLRGEGLDDPDEADEGEDESEHVGNLDEGAAMILLVSGLSFLGVNIDWVLGVFGQGMGKRKRRE